MFNPTEDNFSSHLIDQVNAHTIDLLRVSGSIRREILDLLQLLEDDIAYKLQRISKTSLNGARLKTLLAQVRDTIDAAYGDISQTNLAALGKVAQVSAEQLGEAIAGKIKIPLIDVSFTESQLAALVSRTLIAGMHADEWWKKQSQETFARFQIQMRLGMAQGESIGDLVRRVRGTREMQYTDGLMRVPTYQAEALVRTSVIAIANAGKVASYIKNKDLITAVQWVSTLDSRTTEICIALDSLTWTLPESGNIEAYGEFIPIGHDKNYPGPTAHWNCRSTTIPVLKSFDSLMGPNHWKRDKSLPIADTFKQRLMDKGFTEEEASKIKKDTRASMDGQIGVDNGYEKWLNSKSTSFQNDLLGETAAKLWRSGKIGLTDLTNQDNRPLSADQLLAKVKG